MTSLQSLRELISSFAFTFISMAKKTNLKDDKLTAHFANSNSGKITTLRN